MRNNHLLVPSPRNRPVYLFLIIATMVAGLLLRSRFVSLPLWITKYGGDALWALLVFFGFGFLFSRITTCRLAAVSLATAWAVEFSQLYHAPWLDAVRATRLGHLVLGSTFNWPDLPAYAAGIAFGVLVDRTIRGRRAAAVSP